MNSPEEIGFDPVVLPTEPVEETANQKSVAFLLVGALVTDRSDAGAFQAGANHLFSEVIEGANDGQGTVKKRLDRNDGAGRGGKKQIQEKGLIHILQMVSECNLCATKFCCSLKQRFAPFPGTEEAGLRVCLPEFLGHINLFNYAAKSKSSADFFDSFSFPLRKAGVDVNR